MLNRFLYITILILMWVIASTAQTLEIEKNMDVSPGVTKTFTPILLRNSTDEELAIDEITIEIRNASGIKWRTEASPASIFTENYKRRVESRDWLKKDWIRWTKYVNYFFIPSLLDIPRKEPYIFEQKVRSIKTYRVENEGKTIRLSQGNEAKDMWYLDKNQGIRLSNLPIEIDESVENLRIEVKASLTVMSGQKLLHTSASVELFPFIPQSNILGNTKDHISFKDKKNLKGISSKLNTLPGPVEISCPNSRTMFQVKDRIYLELQNTQGGVRWEDNTIHIFDGEDNEIEFIKGFGYGGTLRDHTERYTVLSFELKDKARTTNIRIEGLALMSMNSSRPILGTYPIMTTLVSGNMHEIPNKQDIMYGNPAFIGSKEPIFLYPNQIDVQLPVISIEEDKAGALITAEHGIRLKIIDQVTHSTQTVRLTRPTLSWSQDILIANYQGSASRHMLQVAPVIESSEIHLQVKEDFQPGDDLEIRGLLVHTLPNTDHKEFKIVASYDGGESYFDIYGVLDNYPRTIQIYDPVLDFNRGKNQSYLYKGKPASLGNLSIINNGLHPLFETGDVLLIKLEENVGTTWNKQSGMKPKILDGNINVENVSYLTVKDEIKLVIKSPLPANERIQISGVSLKEFKKKGRSTFSLAFMNNRTQPISRTNSSIEVTTPLISSLYSQILKQSEPIQELVGIKLTRHEGLGFGEEGILIKIPDDLPVSWYVDNVRQPRVYTDGKRVPVTTNLRNDSKELLIQPQGKLGKTIYLHDLNLKVDNQSTQVATGRLSFSFNQGFSFSNTDEHMLRFIEPQDRYSEDMKKYKTISSNLGANDEPVKFFIAPMPGKTPSPSMMRFSVAADCSLRTSSDYYNPKRVSRGAAEGIEFTLAGKKAVESPGAALIVNNLRIKGIRERMKKVRLGFVLHNYSGVDTLYSKNSLHDLAQNITTIRASKRQQKILPEIKITGGSWEADGPNSEQLLLEEVKILNPILLPTETSRIQILSESNINNIKYYIEIHEYDEARKKIERIIRHSNKYWIGYWLQHWLYASQNKIEDARLAIAEAERFGWVPSDINYSKHPELAESPIDRARSHFQVAGGHYRNNLLWEADSMISMLKDNYITSSLLDTVGGGNRLITEILNLGAKVSMDFHDFSTASEYYYDAADYADDYERYEELADVASIKADSLAQPFMGMMHTEKLPVSEIDFVVRNPFALSGSLMLTGPGMDHYPIEIAKRPHEMGEVVAIQGGVNYRIKPKPDREEFKRLGTAILCVTGILGVAFYNQGF